MLSIDQLDQSGQLVVNRTKVDFIQEGPDWPEQFFPLSNQCQHTLSQFLFHFANIVPSWGLLLWNMLICKMLV